MKILDNFYRFGMDSSSFNGLICVVVMPDDSKKLKKKHEFVKKIMKNVKKSTTWRKFFMGTWAPNQIAQLMFRYFPVVILRFFASAVLFDGIALSFFYVCDFVFFMIFGGFDRFRFLHHEQLRYRASNRWKGLESSFLMVLSSLLIARMA